MKKTKKEEPTELALSVGDFDVKMLARMSGKHESYFADKKKLKQVQIIFDLFNGTLELHFGNEPKKGSVSQYQFGYLTSEYEKLIDNLMNLHKMYSNIRQIGIHNKYLSELEGRDLSGASTNVMAKTVRTLSSMDSDKVEVQITKGIDGKNALEEKRSMAMKYVTNDPAFARRVKKRLIEEAGNE